MKPVQRQTTPGWPRLARSPPDTTRLQLSNLNTAIERSTVGRQDGCRYPEVSPLTYKYAKALVSITNRQASDQLDKISSQIAESVEQGEVNEQESQWLLAIIEDARAGNWEKASDQARKMMEDQLREVE